MYGKWFMSVMAFVGVVLLIIGLASAFAPLLAVGIAACVIPLVLYGFALRRRGQLGDEHATAARERRDAGQWERSTANAAPEAGEGDVDAAHRARATQGGPAS